MSTVTLTHALRVNKASCTPGILVNSYSIQFAMMLLQYYCVIVVLMVVSIDSAAAEILTDDDLPCDSILSLAQALYNISGNFLNLTRIFYPPRQPPVQFVRVKYTFEKNETDDSECDVTYLWAKGGFLLIQPPSVFRFTSLFFNFDENENYDLQLTLPSTCRHLVYINSTSNNLNCSCHNQDEDLGILDIVTHQVRATVKNISSGRSSYNNLPQFPLMPQCAAQA